MAVTPAAQLAEGIKQLEALDGFNTLKKGVWAAAPLTINGQRVYVQKLDDGSIVVLLTLTTNKGKPATALAAKVDAAGNIELGFINKDLSFQGSKALTGALQRKKGAEPSKFKLEAPENSPPEVNLGGIKLVVEGLLRSLSLELTGKEVPDRKASYDVTAVLAKPTGPGRPDERADGTRGSFEESNARILAGFADRINPTDGGFQPLKALP